MTDSVIICPQHIHPCVVSDARVCLVSDHFEHVALVRTTRLDLFTLNEIKVTFGFGHVPLSCVLVRCGSLHV